MIRFVVVPAVIVCFIKRGRRGKIKLLFAWLCALSLVERNVSMAMMMWEGKKSNILDENLVINRTVEGVGEAHTHISYEHETVLKLGISRQHAD